MHAPGPAGGSSHLDEEVKGALLVVAADGSVAPGHILAIDFGGHGNVLSDGETEDVVGTRQGKAVAREINWSALGEGLNDIETRTWQCWGKFGFSSRGETPARFWGSMSCGCLSWEIETRRREVDWHANRY